MAPILYRVQNEICEEPIFFFLQLLMSDISSEEKPFLIFPERIMQAQLAPWNAPKRCKSLQTQS